MKTCLLFMLLTCGLTPAMSACSADETEKESETPKPNPGPGSEVDKTMVVYFSCTNTTKGIAEEITDVTSADFFRIVPVKEYTEEDLNYNNSSSRSSLEQNDPSARPGIRARVENLDDYETIFLGYPIWWGKAPKIILTFLEGHDFSGKTIIPFCTSGSSGIGTSDTDLYISAPAAQWKTGRRFGANSSKQEILNWIESMNLNNINHGMFDLSVVENGKAPTITLSSGYDMPIVGLGTYSLLDEVCVNSVVSAIRNGYRKLDTASIYGNEESVGQGIRQSGIPREEIFVCTKLYPNQFADAENAIDLALKKLDIGYIDLMLLHHPSGKDLAAYKAMERAVASGKVRSIGLSNYYIDEMSAFLPQVSIKPVLVQNEIHPYYQDTEVIEYMHRQGILVEAWYPLGGRGHTNALFNDPVIAEIADSHGKSPAQVILRWDLQKGVVVIPGSGNSDHQAENISIFDFELTDDQVNRINALDRNEKHDWY